MSFPDLLQQTLGQLGDSFLELLDGNLKSFNIRLDIREELDQEAQKLGAIREIDAEHFDLALIKDRGLRVLKDDVVERVALGFLFLDFDIEIIVGIFGFPIGARADRCRPGLFRLE